MGNGNPAGRIELAMTGHRNIQVVARGFLHVRVGAMKPAHFGRLDGRMKRPANPKGLIDIDLKRPETLRQRLYPLNPIPAGGRIMHVLEVVAVRVHGTPVAKWTAEKLI